MSTSDLPYLDDPREQQRRILAEGPTRFAEKAKAHYYKREWAEARTAALISQAYSAILLNVIADDR